MKGFLVFIVIATMASSAQEVERLTVTEDLLQAQSELAIGHEFAELFLADNRKRLSDYLEFMELQILDSFMDGYENIKIKAIETREAMDEFTETSICKDNVRARWELQVTRYGQKLSQCLGIADGYLKDFTSILNRLHDESRAYSNVIPNAGVNVLTGLDIFTSRDNLGRYINNELRRLIFRANSFYNEFEEFVGEISLDRDEYIRQLTACFRSLPRSFENEAMQDLEAISRCYSD